MADCLRLGVGIKAVDSVFADQPGGRLKPTALKSRLASLGFSLADLPDEDLVVLDEDNSGEIEVQEFKAFLEDGTTPLFKTSFIGTR